MLSAILLAAGSSRRMGTNNKLLLPWKGRSIIASTAESLLKAGFEEIIVVTGHEADLITSALKDLPLHLIHNPNFEEGMTSSIQAGVRHATGNGYLIALADMVLITPAEYALLKSTWEKQYPLDNLCIGIPEYQGRKGNPVILPSILRNEILSHPEKEGCKDIVRRHQVHHYRIQMPTDHILRDIDHPEDYTLLSHV